MDPSASRWATNTGRRARAKEAGRPRACAISRTPASERALARSKRVGEVSPKPKAGEVGEKLKKDTVARAPPS